VVADEFWDDLKIGKALMRSINQQFQIWNLPAQKPCEGRNAGSFYAIS
jgi:hypothetical protein